MSEDTLSPITEHFAIIKSVTSRWATPGISRVEHYTDDLEKEGKSMSQCGKFYIYGTDYVFMSECFPLTIPFFYSLEDEIDVCNRAINGIRNEAYKRMEQAIEIPKARITELQQLTYQSAKEATPVCEPDSNIPPDSEYAEVLPPLDEVEQQVLDDIDDLFDRTDWEPDQGTQEVEHSDLPADDLDSDPDHDGM